MQDVFFARRPRLGTGRAPFLIKKRRKNSPHPVLDVYSCAYATTTRESTREVRTACPRRPRRQGASPCLPSSCPARAIWRASPFARHDRVVLAAVDNSHAQWRHIKDRGGWPTTAAPPPLASLLCCCRDASDGCPLPSSAINHRRSSSWRWSDRATAATGAGEGTAAPAGTASAVVRLLSTSRGRVRQRTAAAASPRRSSRRRPPRGRTHHRRRRRRGSRGGSGGHL